MVFGRRGKKELEKQLKELALQKEKLEQEHRLKEQQWQNEQQERQRMEYERQQKEQQERDMEARRRRGKLERLKLTSPEALRGLRDLIRTRYQLDMYIWSLKGARGPDRPLVMDRMERADAVLMEIHTMVETWEENDIMWTADEWKLALKIKERILAEGKRWWENNPPWNEA